MKERPKIFFRVDASPKIGRGHLVRMLAMAGMLQESFQVTFIILESNRLYCEGLIEAFEAIYLENDTQLPQIVSVNDVLCIDGYEFDEPWREKIQPHVLKLVMISDFPAPLKYVNLIIDPSPGTSADKYDGSEAEGLLLGLEYTLIRQQFRKAALSSLEQVRERSGLFLAFGSTDPFSLVPFMAEALVEAGFTDRIYLLSQEEALIRKFQNVQQVKVVNGLGEKELIDLAKQIRVAVVSAGVLSLEMVALRLPMYLTYFVDNQRFNYEGLLEKGVAFPGGFIEQSSDFTAKAKEIIDLYSNNTKQNSMIISQTETIDGHSGERLVNKLIQFLNNL